MRPGRGSYSDLTSTASYSSPSSDMSEPALVRRDRAGVRLGDGWDAGSSSGVPSVTSIMECPARSAGAVCEAVVRRLRRAAAASSGNQGGRVTRVEHGCEHTGRNPLACNTQARGNRQVVRARLPRLMHLPMAVGGEGTLPGRLSLSLQEVQYGRAQPSPQGALEA